jgi:hypothetical protein
MCGGGSKPAPAPTPAPNPVVYNPNPSTMGMENAPELVTADVMEDEELKKKLKKKQGTTALQTDLAVPTSGANLNIA